MKKILFVSFLAVALMACNSNSADMPKNEKKAFDASTIEAIDMMGDDAATVEAKLVKAGYVLLDEAMPLIAAPAKRVPGLKKDRGGDKELYFAYNLPENYDEMSEEEAIEYINKLLADGNSYIMVTATFEDDELYMMGTAIMTGIRDKVNYIYTDLSDDLFAQLPSGSMGQWQGAAGKSMGKEDPEMYADHSKFVAAIKDATEITAEEMGVAITANNPFQYIGLWVYPNKEQQASQKESGLKPYCMGTIAITSGAIDLD